MIDQLAERERDKYERMWNHPQYSAWSPGEESADEAIRLFGEPGTLFDFGCGDGKALDKFKAAGFAATGIDHVQMRPEVVKACLWALPTELQPACYGFCADVLEHIPTVNIETVLKELHRIVRMHAYFRISTIPDSMGGLIGETLHLTVRPADWWQHRVREAFGRSEVLRVTDDHVVIWA